MFAWSPIAIHNVVIAEKKKGTITFFWGKVLNKKTYKGEQ